MNDLYQDNILDHANNPRNKAPRPLTPTPDPSHKGRGEMQNTFCGEGDNPSCGDSGEMCVKLTSIISYVSWSGVGCAISQASMSMMSEYIKGKSVNDLKMMMPGDVYEMLGIQITPSRVNCALLSYRAIEKIIQQV